MTDMTIISLGEYKGITLQIPKITVSDEEIECMISDMLQKHTAYTAVKHRTVQPKDRITVELLGSLDGVFSDDYSIHEHRLIAGIELAPMFEHRFLGMNIGEKVTTSIDFPATYEDHEVAGKTLTVTGFVTLIEEPCTPLLTEEFCKQNLHCTSIEEYREILEEELLEDKQIKQQNECMYRLLETVCQRTEFAISDALIEEVMMARGYPSKELAMMDIRSNQILMAIAEEEGFTKLTQDPNQLSMMAIQTIYNNAVIRTI